MSDFKASLLRWPGGKFHALKLIIPKLNPHINSAEIFGGGVSITLNMPRLKISKTEIINDASSAWYNFWKVIKEKGTNYMEEIAWVFAGDDWIREYSGYDDDVRSAIYFYLRNRNSMAGFKSASPGNQHTFPNNPIVKNISWWAERLRNVRIYNMDCFELLAKLNNLSTKWLLILDPPYVKEGAKGHKMYVDENLGSDQEDLGFTKKDHERLSEMLHQSPHEIFMTYDDDPFIRELYSDFYITEAQWDYHAAKGKVKKSKVELFVTNLELKEYGRSATATNW